MKTKEQLLLSAEQCVKDNYPLLNNLIDPTINLRDLLIDFYLQQSKLNLDEFKTIPDGMPFMFGYSTNTPDGLYMNDNGGDLRWVAVKGYVNDWCIYIGWIYYSLEYIMSNGDKLHSIEYIQRCIDCTKEVYDLYRY